MFHGFVCAKRIVELVEKIVLLGDEIVAEKLGVDEADFHGKNSIFSVSGFEFRVSSLGLGVWSPNLRAESNTSASFFLPLDTEHSALPRLGFRVSSFEFRAWGLESKS
jgi:hypothetical protein